MHQLLTSTLFLSSLILVGSNTEPFIPSSYNFSTLGVLAANGSSAVAGCSNVTQNLDRTSTCNTPSTSVLFDRNTPTLAGLNGDTWASQLMIYYRPGFGYNSFSLYFDFTANPWYSAVSRVEVTIFNCPQWGTGVERVYVEHRPSTYYQHLARAYPTLFSCTSLVKVCIPFSRTSSRQIRLNFGRYSGFHQVHIAEVAFYSRNSSCPPFTTIPGEVSPPTTTQSSTALTTEKTMANTSLSYTTDNGRVQNTTTTISPSCTKETERVQAEGSVQLELKGSSHFTTLLAVLAAIMAVQTAVILIVALVVALKYKKMSKDRQASYDIKQNEASEVEDRLYDTVNVKDGHVATTSCRLGQSATIQLQQNSSYA